MDIAGAEKKLRQAEFFLVCLDDFSKDIAIQIRKSSGPPNHEPLEFYFSACLSAAQSVYTVLEETGGKGFQQIQRDWRKSLKKGSRFGKMKRLRGEDVHFALTGATPKPKYIEENRNIGAPYSHSHMFHNAALVGRLSVLEEKNPDGVVVRGSSLSGTIGLYLDWGGQQIEASTLCREFIEQLRSLLDALKK